MRLESLKIGGIGRFHGDVEIPIAELGGAEVVAITGENGEGKTTAIECVPGAFYRTMPSRGATHILAGRRDSYIETVMSLLDGQRLTAKLMINGVAKTPKTEAYLSDENGPLTEGKVREFAAEIAKRLPSSEVFLASAFAAQNGEGAFLNLPVARRKGMFSDMLGCGHLEEMSKAAGERGRAVEAKVKEDRARVEALNSQASKVGELEVELTKRSEVLAGAKLELEEAQEEAGRLRAELENRMAQETKIQRAVDAATAKEAEGTRKRDESEKRESEAVEKRNNIRARRSGLEARLQGEEQLQQCVDAATPAQNRIAELEERLAEQQTAIEEHHTEVAEWMERTNEARQSLDSATARRAAIVDAAARARRTEEAAHTTKMDEWRPRLEGAKRDLTVANSERSNKIISAGRSFEDAERELSSLRESAGRLGDVPCGGEGEFSGCPLISAATEAEGKIGTAESAVEMLRQHLTDTQEDRSGIEIAEEFVSDVEAEKPEDLPPPTEVEDTGEVAAATTKLEEVDATKPQSPPVNIGVIKDEIKKLRPKLVLAEEARASIAAFAEVRAQVKQLDTDLTEASAQVQAAADQVARANVEFDGLRASVLTAVSDLHEHRELTPEAPDPQVIREHNEAITDAAAAEASTTTALKLSIEALRKSADLVDAITDQLNDLDDWRHLQAALGRNGVQALEIDAAGPEVSDLTNELLHACYGPRFTVSLETTQPKADGKGTKEVFDLMVIDTKHGTEGSADQLSGGEKVLVSEALSLAIAIYNTRRSSIPMLDLFRDEVAGALSSKNAKRYIEMLRRALAIGGFHRVYFIAHQAELWGLADAILLFEGGQCRIVDQDSPATTGG